MCQPISGRVNCINRSLEKEYKGQNPDVLLQCWNIACDIGGAFSEKLKAFGCGGFQSNCLTWNHLIFKIKNAEYEVI